MKEDDKMVVKKPFEKICNKMECTSYIRNEDSSKNKEIFIYGFKHMKTDKINDYILFG